MKASFLGTVIVLALVGCGGGTTESTTTTTTPTTSETATTTTSSTTSTTTSGGETTSTTTTTTTSSVDAATWQAQVTAGADLFDHKCSTCHGEGGTGDGAPDLRNVHFTPERMRTQIRNGSGRMRPIPVARLADADMEQVLAWLTTIGAVDQPHP